MTIDRIEPPLTGGERETLRAYLDWHRATPGTTGTRT
ncbi:hypothetical protein FHU33_2918 [Blastococcus colisei]|uniref:Uncharacterized protein n=1 Tax=Blastococcus colisei TaxID=1564162 RepID=A0A543PHB2_9ACTN|nr:hypothetical protein FHU33_2918 [Blastococcus colisei]